MKTIDNVSVAVDYFLGTKPAQILILEDYFVLKLFNILILILGNFTTGKVVSHFKRYFCCNFSLQNLFKV